MIDDVQVIKSEVAPVVEQARGMVVDSPESYKTASDFLKCVKGAQSKVAAFFAPMKQKAHEAHKAITTQEAETLRPLQDAESAVKRVMLTYFQEQERLRIEEQRKAQALADEQARRERERLEREASKLKTPELREERLEQAAAVQAPMVQVVSAVPVIQGQSIRKTWTAKVVNRDLVPREYMVVNEIALNAFAKATKGAVKIPGVEFIEVSNIASGRG